MSELLSRIDDWLFEHRVDCLSFLQELISIPSPSYEESKISEIIGCRMREYGFDTVVIDSLSSVMAIIKGRENGRSLLLNGHIDHVPIGEMTDPYSGRIMDGLEFGVEGEVVYGRASCDMKAAVASMIIAGRMLKELGIHLKGDFKVAAVSQEEVGGAGTVATIIDNQFLGDLVIIGEATNMGVYLGHRGSMKFSVVVKGRSCHASAPERGVNALYKAVKMIQKIQDELIPRLPDHPIYGRVSLVVTQIEVSPKALNVVPEECRFYIDCRNHPAFTSQLLYNELRKIIRDLHREDADFQATVIPNPIINEKTFTGFYTDPEQYPVVSEIIQTVKESYDEPKVGVWSFATDGRIYSRLGIPVIGFGPGEEKFAHTQQDHVKINDFLDSIKVYAWIACRFCGLAESGPKSL